MKNTIKGPHGETLDLTSQKVHVGESRIAIDTDDGCQWIRDEINGPFRGEWHLVKKGGKPKKH